MRSAYQCSGRTLIENRLPPPVSPVVGTPRHPADTVLLRIADFYAQGKLRPKGVRCSRLVNIVLPTDADLESDLIVLSSVAAINHIFISGRLST